MDFRLETAAALWEAALTLRGASMTHGDDALLADVFGQFLAHGIAGMRLHISAMTDECVRAWSIFSRHVEDPAEAYDYGWCAGFVRSAIDWSGLEPRVDARLLADFGNSELEQNGAQTLAAEQWLERAA